MSCDEYAVKQFLRQSRKLSDDKVASSLSDRTCNDRIPLVLSEWSKRGQILALCSKIATNPSADDDAKIAALWLRSRENISLPETAVNPRIDSYGARDEQYEEQQLKQMNAWVRREMMAEEVVRDTTDGFFQQRCGFSILKLAQKSDEQ